MKLKNTKPFSITAKVGIGRRRHLILGWQFATRENAKRFATIFLDRNPLCKTYTIYEF